MSMPDAHSLYQAFCSRDRRFDGHYFVGVSSTGIYCRPVCSARTPRESNCSFYTSAASAEAAGFRPCLLCRPERAPGTATVDSSHQLAREAARILQATCGDGITLGDLAGRLGCSDRHLRRVFRDDYGVSPSTYTRTCRLLLAKSLLMDTRLPVADVAITSGFGSVRRFNEAFRQHYQLSPTALRTQHRPANVEGVTLRLGYRPPYRWEEILTFLGARAIPGVEQVSCADDDGAGQYTRTVRLSDGAGSFHTGWVTVRHDEGAQSLAVMVSPSLLPVLSQVLSRVSRLFDLT